MYTIMFKMQTPQSLNLPIACGSILQGAIYKLLRYDPAFSDTLHQGGADYHNRNYKLFTFSRLVGHNELVNKRLLYSGEIIFEIRTAEEAFAKILIAAAKKERHINFGGDFFPIVDIITIQQPVLSKQVKIQMIAPITVHTSCDDGRSHYYSPFEPDFFRLVNENFQHKYSAFCEETFTGGVKLSVLRCSERDKCVTTFKGTYITGWYGQFMLSGEEDYLEFLYYTGLGARNSQGFGMFKII